jgi:hypothetical protein
VSSSLALGATMSKMPSTLLARTTAKTCFFPLYFVVVLKVTSK